jgi:hypothetical protein
MTITNDGKVMGGIIRKLDGAFFHIYLTAVGLRVKREVSFWQEQFLPVLSLIDGQNLAVTRHHPSYIRPRHGC